MANVFDDNSSSTSTDSSEAEDYLQQVLRTTEPIPGVERQAYILIVGDSKTGKSTLARALSRPPRTEGKRYYSLAVNPSNPDQPPKDGSSIGLHFFCAPYKSGDKNCFLHQPPDQQLFSLIIYLCDVVMKDTFDNIFKKWHPEILDYMRKDRLPPALLVGNKSDMRVANMPPELCWNIVPVMEARISAIQAKAREYIEISALNEDHTRDLLAKICKILHVNWQPDF